MILIEVKDTGLTAIAHNGVTFYLRQDQLKLYRHHEKGIRERLPKETLADLANITRSLMLLAMAILQTDATV
jgi:hypothetical protein